MTAVTQDKIDSSTTRLHRLAPAGSTVFTVLRHVSSSGMTRWIDLYVIIDNEPHWLSRHATNIGIGTWDDKRESVKVGGTGMDMGFHLVYSLSRKLHDDGYALNHRWL